ncbi:MAG TPA: hypothetical protein VK891_05725, partial [Euzebyales bacterium]|nr:hypothetical protein [Euzebyales bacterium]
MAVQPANLTAVCLALAAADSAGPACLLPAGDQTLIARLIDQLKRHGVGRVLVLTRPEWREACAEVAGAGVEVEGHATLSDMLARIAVAADAAPSDLLMAHADILTHDGVIAGMLADPRVRTGVLSSSRSPQGLTPRLRISRGRVVASESAYHRVDSHNSYLLGICKIGRADVSEAAAAARELAGLSAEGLPDDWGEEFAGKVADRGATVLAAQAGAAVLADQLHAADPLPALFPGPDALRARLAAEYEAQVARPAEALRDDPMPLLAVGLIRRDVMLTSAYLRELFWDRPVSEAGAAAAYRQMADIDEDRVLLASAVKATDGFFTTFFVSSYSRYIARWAARHGLTPNQVTSVSMLLGVIAALAFAT